MCVWCVCRCASLAQVPQLRCVVCVCVCVCVCVQSRFLGVRGATRKTALSDTSDRPSTSTFANLLAKSGCRIPRKFTVEAPLRSTKPQALAARQTAVDGRYRYHCERLTAHCLCSNLLMKFLLKGFHHTGSSHNEQGTLGCSDVSVAKDCLRMCRQVILKYTISSLFQMAAAAEHGVHCNVCIVCVGVEFHGTAGPGAARSSPLLLLVAASLLVYFARGRLHFS